MKTKKLLALLLTLVMVIGLLPTMALAGQQEISFKGSGITGYDTVIEINVSIGSVDITKIYIKTVSATDTLTVKAGENFRNSVYCINGTTDIKPQKGWKSGTALSDSELSSLETTAKTIKDTITNFEFNQGCSKYFFAAFNCAGNGEIKYGLLIQVEGEAETITDEDKKPLKDLLDTVKDDNNAYYTSGDCWNGKTYEANGHWNSFVATTPKKGPRATAQAVLDNPKSKDEITQAVTDLQTAIDKLIPITQANTTLLYEATKAYKDTTNSYGGKSPYWTDASWNNFTAKRDAAETLMDSMFNADGSANTTYNVYAAQADVNAKAAALTQAYDDLFPISLQEGINTWHMAETWLLGKTKLDKDDYTSNSWKDWSDDYAALNAVKGKTITLASDYETWTTAIMDAAAAYAGLTSAEDIIKVHVRVADNYGAAYPTYALADEAVATYDADVTLSGDHRTVDGVMEAISYTGTQKNDGKAKYGPTTMVYINGELSVALRGSNVDTWSTGHVNTRQLHDDDSIVLVRAESPWVFRYTEDDRYSAPYKVYSPYVGLLDIAGDRVLTVEAGVELALTVNRYPGAIGATLYPVPTENVSLLLSEVKATEDSAAATPATVDTGARTDKEGKASTMLFDEGWYRLEAVITEEQTNALGANPDNIVGGDYSNLFGGDYVLVHVVHNDDEAAVREGFLAELTEAKELYPESYFTTDGWQTISAAYTEGCSNIESAATLAQSKAALDAAKTAIKNAQTAATRTNADTLESFRRQLGKLPDDAAKLTQGQNALMAELIEKYKALSGYAKNQLTSGEAKKYNDLVKAYGTDGSSLPAGQTYALRWTWSVADAADKAVFEALFAKMKEMELTGEQPFLANDFISEALPSTRVSFLEPYSNLNYVGIDNLNALVAAVDGFTYDSAKGKWYVNGKEYEIKSVTLNGESISIKNASYDFSVPYEDVTVAVVYSPVVTLTEAEQQLAEKKAAALAELKTAYESYHKSNYSTAKWAELTGYYNAGKAAIEAAAEADIEAAKRTAIANMAGVKTLDQEEQSSTVGPLGTVHVIVENTTYSGAPAVLYGTIAQADIPLDTDTTMMTAVLDTLEQAGYAWIGTGGNPTGKDITYLATVSYGDDSLSEFDGEPTSGWMGVLNDWFVNESFASFTTTATARDYRVVDGDEIRVMFTLKGYGKDLGGSWGNPDTSLKDLTYKGGTLTPAFDPTVKEYLLMTSGGSVSVTPTAANKNYQVKTFLNEKNTARDVEYYRRGEPIPVQTGDVIWIGCGEKNWLSMNNQGAEATGYSGTWYSITVVDSNSSAAVEQAIEKIGSVTYSNYESKEAAVKAARAAYDNLSAAAKGQVTNSAKLETAEQKIEDYKKIDNVKALLAALPKSANMSDDAVKAARGQIEAAYAAYDKLSEEQRGYITVGDAKNYNELVERLKELTPSTSAQTIVGSEKKKEDEGSDIAPAQVAVAPEVVNGEAKAEIAAEDVSKAIEEAPDAKTLTVKVETEGADKVEADLPAEAVKAAADAGMGVNVETENGTVKLSAADVKAASGKDLAVSVTENSDGSTTIGVTAGGKAVNTKVKVELPAAKDGQMLVIVGADGKETPVILSASEDGTMYAQVPAGSTVKVVDAEGKDFGDVKAGDWFAEAVEFVSSHGIFQGTGEGFEPGTTMNRAMLAMVLYRIDGAAGGGKSTFDDVKPEDWFADAVAWAADAGIVNGRGEGFAPDAPVTREEIATMLYRFVKHLGVDVSGASADLSKFPDGGETSSWAGDAMAWAVSAGLFQGDEAGALNPGGEATRAEVATLLQRLVGLMVK